MKRSLAPAGAVNDRPLKKENTDTIRFHIYNPADKHNASFDVEVFGKNPAKGASSSEDDAFYVLKFHRPGLKRIELYTLYVIKNDSECLYAQTLNKAPSATRVLMDRKYVSHETYTLAQDTEDAGVTYALYIQIERNQSVHVDMTLSWLATRAKIKNATVFHPWDVDVSKYGLKLDTRTVPQRTPLWFKTRGQVTGTKAYMLLGYWVPTKAQDPNWTLEGDKTFSEFQKRNMRFGVESEDKALLLYLHHNPQVQVELCGLCKAPPPLPNTWGASPDGVVYDKSHTWEDVPKKIREYWSTGATPPSGGLPNSHISIDPSKGVLEIKSTSGGKNGMEPYFFPQVYMEMICTQTLWADVVRYTQSGARVYRVYRHKPTEETLLSLLKYALSNVDRLRDVIAEPPFVKIRDYFERLALTMSYVELEATPAYLETRNAYEAYLKQRQNEGRDQVVGTKKHNTDDMKHRLDAIQQQHTALYGHFNDPAQFKALICKQLEAYTSILREL